MEQQTIDVDTGDDSVTVSVAETQYAACACSPPGKLYRTSRAHAPGTAPLWTTYTYDASGRTIGHSRWSDPGHRSVHESGAGAADRGRQTCGHLGVWRGAV
jgi:hypothetical protein